MTVSYVGCLLSVSSVLRAFGVLNRILFVHTHSSRVSPVHKPLCTYVSSSVSAISLTLPVAPSTSGTSNLTWPFSFRSTVHLSICAHICSQAYNRGLKAGEAKWENYFCPTFLPITALLIGRGDSPLNILFVGSRCRLCQHCLWDSLRVGTWKEQIERKTITRDFHILCARIWRLPRSSSFLQCWHSF